MFLIKHRLLSTVLSTALILVANSSLASQVGEHATYKVIKDRLRTSTLIKDGTFSTTIKKHLPDHPKGESYKVIYDYNLEIHFSDDAKDSGKMVLPINYFDGNLLAKLRSDGTLSTDHFDARYIGRKNVNLADGRSFPNCDVVELSNLNLESFQKILFALAKATGRTNLEDIKNLKIKGYIHPTLPVLGIVKADFSAKISGLDFKIGFDHLDSRKK